ncbi:MAG: SdpI family protein [Gemmatimonadales bacterium]
MRRLWPGLLAIAAAAAFGALAYPHLPARIPTHFDLHGQPNGWSSRLVAVLITPAIGLILAAVFAVLPKIDPRRANYARFGGTYWLVVNAVVILLAAIQVVIVGKALGWAIDITRVASIGIGALFILLGNVMTRIRPNWFMGIRTPWTLSSDTVWRKTHRLGGVLFVIAGVCVVAAGFIASGMVFITTMVMLGLASLISVVYSYFVWKAEQGAAA